MHGVSRCGFGAKSFGQSRLRGRLDVRRARLQRRQRLGEFSGGEGDVRPRRPSLAGSNVLGVRRGPVLLPGALDEVGAWYRVRLLPARSETVVLLRLLVPHKLIITL